MQMNKSELHHYNFAIKWDSFSIGFVNCTWPKTCTLVPFVHVYYMKYIFVRVRFHFEGCHMWRLFILGLRSSMLSDPHTVWGFSPSIPTTLLLTRWPLTSRRNGVQSNPMELPLLVPYKYMIGQYGYRVKLLCTTRWSWWHFLQIQ